MGKTTVMVIGAKESFVIRVLVKKLIDSEIDAFYAPATVDSINEGWNKCSLITYYMDGGEVIHDEVRRFLIDKITDEGKPLILIGDKVDAKAERDKMPSDVIYTIFPRPLDNELYIKTVSDLFDKIEHGEFKKSILVVDDDMTYLGLVREWLKDDYRVAMANSGLQAIKWLGKNKADLILLDYEMPITSGPQVLEMLRADEETKHIPVIFLTGKGDKASVMGVVALKPEGYLLKTIQKDELLDNLQKYFQLHAD